METTNNRKLHLKWLDLPESGILVSKNKLVLIRKKQTSKEIQERLDDKILKIIGGK